MSPCNIYCSTAGPEKQNAKMQRQLIPLIKQKPRRLPRQKAASTKKRPVSSFSSHFYSAYVFLNGGRPTPRKKSVGDTMPSFC